MPEKMFKFTVTNERTHETTSFLGQGTNLLDALKDGMKNVDAPFQPKNDGRPRVVHGLAVQTGSGIVKRTLVEFESDEPATIEEL